MNAAARNKAIQIADIALKFKQRLVVHPNAFVMHLPHPKALAWSVTMDSSQYGMMIDLWDEIYGEIGNGTYVPVTTFGNLCPKRRHIGTGDATLD